MTRRWLALGLLPWLIASIDAKAVVDSSPPKSRGVIVLFGSSEHLKSNWRQHDNTDPTWQVRDGVMIAGGGDIYTKQVFSDFQLHVEFKVPLMQNRVGQQRGNSGIKLHGRYEIQILDSYGKETPGTGDCGALYQQAAPLVNAAKPPNEWQSFDITFRAPRFDLEGRVLESARVTVVQNGVAVLNNQEIKVPTGKRGGNKQAESGPIRLQDHRCLVEFRNIWILPLPLKGSGIY